MKPKNNCLLPEAEEILKEEEEPPPRIRNLGIKGSFLMPPSPAPFYPYLFQNHLTPSQQGYFQTNGYVSLIKSLEVAVISHLEQCRCLWQRFSPKTTLFDTWDFRLAFWQGYRYDPYFIVLRNHQEAYALLPLWFAKNKREYTWFGSDWQEENKFFCQSPLFIPLLLAICPAPVTLNAISDALPSWVRKVIRLKPDEPKYILRLDAISSSDDYLSTLKKKKRYNLKRDKRIIEFQKPQIIFNHFTDLDALVALSKERFNQKGEETDWEDPRRVETFRQVIKLGQKGNSYRARMITVKIGDQIAAVDLVVLYRGCYYPLKCGYDVKKFPGIGNFVNLLEIDDAVNLGMEKMDFLEIGYGWKEKWFEPVPLFQYQKK